MQLARYPRGRENARAIDAAPVKRPHHPEYGYEASPPQLETDWVGWRATDELGKTVGRVEGTLQPDWLILSGRRHHHVLVPAENAIAGGEAVFLPFSQEAIESAPAIEPEKPIAASLLAEARSHYHAASAKPRE